MEEDLAIFGYRRAEALTGQFPMREHVRLDGLLFSRDKQILSVMNEILDSFAIETEVFA